MEHRTLMLLVGCGAAAGAVAGIFKAPIAGLVFTLEVIDDRFDNVLLVAVADICGDGCNCFLYRDGYGCHVQIPSGPSFRTGAYSVCHYAGYLLRIGFLYFTRAMNSVEGVFGRLRTPYKKLIMGGAMLSILIFLFPPLYGEGYDTIELLLNGMSNAEWDTVMNNSFFYGHGNLLLIYLILIILFKVFASSATNGGGGCGGIFAPSLYLGCIAGFVFSHFSNEKR